MKQSEKQNGDSFVMKNMSEGSQSIGRDPYSEDTVLAKDTYTVVAGRGKGGLERLGSPAGESDNSIDSYEARCGPRRSVQRGLTIVKTTEVAISR